MIFLRHKRWNYMTKLAPAVTMVSSGRRYLADGSGDGAVAVPYKQDAEELLNPPSEGSSVWAVAWEKYGIAFDAQGKVVEPVVEDTIETITDEKPRRGRPPKAR